MTGERKKSPQAGKPVVLAAIHDENLWEELSEGLSENFTVRRETDGLRAIEVMLVLRPAAVIAETGLPSLSGILLARLLGHNRYLSKLPVALILSRDYLIEEFWAKDSGAIVTVPRNNASDAISHILIALPHTKPIIPEQWKNAEFAIEEAGGPAVGVANELEKQLIGANIISKLGEIEIASDTNGSDQAGTIPVFIHKALSALSSVLEFAQAGVTLFDSKEFYTVKNEIFSEMIDHEAFIRESKTSCSLYTRHDVDCEEPEIIELTSVRHELPGPLGPASTYFALPLTGRDGIYGLLSIMTYKEIAVREYYLHTLSLIGSQLAVTLERALFYEELRHLSVTDALTGLSNRRAILAKLDDEFRRSVRYRSPLSVAVCDLDDFKKLNDKHGHLAGDEMLKAVADILKDSVREVDLAGRWGGEEMALLFPQTGLSGAMIACERIRERISGLKVNYQGIELGTSLSIGIATIDSEKICPRSPDVLMGLADSAMYLAKNRGKDSVANYLELPEELPVQETQ